MQGEEHGLYTTQLILQWNTDLFYQEAKEHDPKSSLYSASKMLKIIPYICVKVILSEVCFKGKHLMDLSFVSVGDIIHNSRSQRLCCQFLRTCNTVCVE